MRSRTTGACSRWVAEPGLTAPGQTFECATTGRSNSIFGVIYCVVPEALAGELFGKLTHYYADDPNVTVIVDRRRASRRDRRSMGGGQREIRDRRRARVPGDIPDLASD